MGNRQFYNYLENSSLTRGDLQAFHFSPQIFQRKLLYTGETLNAHWALTCTEQWFSYLKGFVEKQTEVCKDHPQFLPAIAILEFPQ